LQRLGQITEHRAVTLIGESWGGAVALAMAQALESQGVLVSLSLLNGVPGHVLEWIAENVAANDNMNASLLSRYLSIDDEVPCRAAERRAARVTVFVLPPLQIAKKFASQREWDAGLVHLLRSNKVPCAGDVCRALDAVQTQLNTLMAFEPLPNKLLAVPQVFMSSELSGKTANVLAEVRAAVRVAPHRPCAGTAGLHVVFRVCRQFCVGPPVIHIVAGARGRDDMLEDAKVVKTINENVAFDYPHSSTRSLDDKYSQHYYDTEVPLVC